MKCGYSKFIWGTLWLLIAVFIVANQFNGFAEIGAISLRVPKHWRVIDDIDCALGGVDIGKNNAVPSDTSPTLTLKGSVSLGGVEVKFV